MAWHDYSIWLPCEYESESVCVGLSLKPCKPFNATAAWSACLNCTSAVPTEFVGSVTLLKPANCSKRSFSIFSVVEAGSPLTQSSALRWAPAFPMLVKDAQFDRLSPRPLVALSLAWLSAFLPAYLSCVGFPRHSYCSKEDCFCAYVKLYVASVELLTKCSSSYQRFIVKSKTIEIRDCADCVGFFLVDNPSLTPKLVCSSAYNAQDLSESWKYRMQCWFKF